MKFLMKFGFSNPYLKKRIAVCIPLVGIAMSNSQLR